MKLNHLELHFSRDGSTDARLWIECHTVHDVDVLESWARFARRAMKEWGDIHAKASHAAQTAAGENENYQPREISDQASPPIRANRTRPLKAAADAA